MDEFYEVAVVRRTIDGAAWLWTFFDVKVIDGAVNGIAVALGAARLRHRPLQTGRVQNYALRHLRRHARARHRRSAGSGGRDVSWHDQIGFPILSVITYLPLAAWRSSLLFGKGRPGFYKVVALVTTAGRLRALGRSCCCASTPGGRACSTPRTSSGSSASTSTTASASTASPPCCIFLTTLLGVIVIIASWNYVKDRERGFFVSLLLLQTGMIGVFCATDIFLFYVFWEAMLVPMYFIIGIWGGPRRIYAAIKFFLFTLVGSLLMLVAIIVIGLLREGPRPVSSRSTSRS